MTSMVLPYIAIHEGNLLPVKIVPSKGTAYVTYGGVTYAKRKYEVGSVNTCTYNRNTHRHSSHV